MDYFVDERSIVRRIWGKSDTILVIFAGAAAEFALSKAVDWLYFTGKLPADPLGRLFSTVSYARAIVFAERPAAHRAIDAITAIHKAVETKRGSDIPDWAYRHVLFMLVDYSIRSFEVLERPLSTLEKQEVLDVFGRVGSRMGIKDLPQTMEEWKAMRDKQLQEDLQYSAHTADLFQQYRKHLGEIRYRLLRETQRLMVPQQVHRLLAFKRSSLLTTLVPVYKFSRQWRADWLLKELLLPQQYKKEIRALDIWSA